MLLRFGLAKVDYEESQVGGGGGGNMYKDRAKIRRDQVGIDTSHIAEKRVEITSTTASTSFASVHEPISEENVGKKMLLKMGWKEGVGIGKKHSGIVEPVCKCFFFCSN